MSATDDRSKMISFLSNFLQREGRNPMAFEEEVYLNDEYLPGMTVFELTGLLWEFRFSGFLRKLLELCPNANIEDLKSLARTFYLKGLQPHDASKEYKERTAKKRQANNESAPTPAPGVS